MLSRSYRLLASFLIPVVLTASPTFADRRCTDPDTGERLSYPENVLIELGGLAVNPDGTTASYTVGDHGYTYLANGVNLVGKPRIPCAPKANNIKCRNEWLKAEAQGFRAGSPVFCVFAMEVVPIEENKPRVPCERELGDGRFLVGDGKGRPKIGENVPTATGSTTQTYVSTTALKHLVGGEAVSVDAAKVPGIVVPRSHSSLLGSVAWVSYKGRATFALVTDIGPRFGEASIALHQMLQYGSLQNPQPVGPIPKDQRCSTSELKLKAPFQSKPDHSEDVCKRGRTVETATDIRAYAGMEDGVTTIILPDVKPRSKGGVIQSDLATVSLSELAKKGGYTEKKLKQMASCGLKQGEKP